LWRALFWALDLCDLQSDSQKPFTRPYVSFPAN
jgi:hypothetical protein